MKGGGQLYGNVALASRQGIGNRTEMSFSQAGQLRRAPGPRCCLSKQVKEAETQPCHCARMLNKQAKGDSGGQPHPDVVFISRRRNNTVPECCQSKQVKEALAGNCVGALPQGRVVRLMRTLNPKS